MSKRILFVFFLIPIFIFANPSLKNMAQLYIEYGEGKIIQNLNSLIRDKKFWRNYIENINTKYGYFGYKDYLILASKQTKSIDIFKIKNKNPHLYKHLPALFGSIDGDKQAEGDKKTPIGVYDFIARLDQGGNKLDQKYGPLALVTTYPNLMDKLMHKKTGHGIWLHGKPLIKTKKIDTLGCVAIDNNELSQLGEMIDYKKALLVISKDKYATASKDEIASILASLYTWKYHWEQNNFEQYISFYADNFRRYDNKSLRVFRDFKQKVFAKGGKKSITFTQINIVPYIQGDGQKLFKISFFEKYTSGGYKFKGQKNLYTKLINNKISILIEE